MAILIKRTFCDLAFFGSSLVCLGSSLVFYPRGIGEGQGEGILIKGSGASASGVTRRPGEGNIVTVIDCRANEEENAEYLADEISVLG
jgi:hypothetical protein